jgi:hypothetical protein
MQYHLVALADQRFRRASAKAIRGTGDEDAAHGSFPRE